MQAPFHHTCMLCKEERTQKKTINFQRAIYHYVYNLKSNSKNNIFENKMRYVIFKENLLEKIYALPLYCDKCLRISTLFKR